jgi:hypothetical protein
LGAGTRGHECGALQERRGRPRSAQDPGEESTAGMRVQCGLLISGWYSNSADVVAPPGTIGALYFYSSCVSL